MKISEGFIHGSFTYAIEDSGHNFVKRVQI